MTNRSTILVVDDEPSICWALERMLVGEGHDVMTASSAEEGLRLAETCAPAMVILDVRLPHQDGITALPKFLAATNNAPVIIITAFGDLETAVAAVKSGATDYLTKPFKLEEALRKCRSTLRKASSSAPPTATEPMSMDTSVLVGTSPAMQQVFRQIALVADSDLSVLITGETGSGKELVAAAIHRHSPRADQPYITIAPVALNPDLIESELFGHVKGAFTGATEDRAGLFESAAGGTVLLDEIGDLPLGTQVKLLRVLEQGQFSRVGDVQTRTADVRILAATNAQLHHEVATGAFREDLFHRLTGVQIHLPPLRERTEDIEPLCRHFLDAMNYADVDSAIDESLLDALRQRPWHGNVRELKNAVRHAAVVARGRALMIEDFPPPKPGREAATDAADVTLDEVVRDWARKEIDHPSDMGTSLHERFLAAAEPSLLQIALEHTGGNRAKAAELLGMHRGTLRERLRNYGLNDE
jgi:two-component system nitrogen regulation response regulator GlnG